MTAPDLNNPTIKKLIKDVAAIDTSDTSELDSITDLIFAKIPDHHLKQQFVDKTKAALLKWKDTEIAKARKEAQLQILRGFRRHDFVRGDFYELAVIDRIQKIAEEK